MSGSRIGHAHNIAVHSIPVQSIPLFHSTKSRHLQSTSFSLELSTSFSPELSISFSPGLVCVSQLCWFNWCMVVCLCCRGAHSHWLTLRTHELMIVMQQEVKLTVNCCTELHGAVSINARHCRYHSILVTQCHLLPVTWILRLILGLGRLC